MRVLLSLHHELDADQGAPGATLALGAALEAAGCSVEYFGFGQAFPGDAPCGGDASCGITQALRFPWRMAAFLAKHAKRFDIVDASTGDSWVWASAGRPGARKPTALITRSHGLEQTANERLRADARAGSVRLSWKYPIYHGGFRLWEVERSLRQADHIFLLNPLDFEYAVRRMQIAPGRVSVLPNGIGDHLLDLPVPGEAAEALRIAFIGRWTHAKGADIVQRTASLLRDARLRFEIRILGCSCDPESVRNSFHAALRGCVTVMPRFHNRELPALLGGCQVFVFPSRTEGFGLALVEAMACGLAPITTPVGVAPSLVKTGHNGVLVPVDEARSVAAAVLRLASDPDLLLRMRRNAREAAQTYRWGDIAKKTVEVYRSVLARRWRK